LNRVFVDSRILDERTKSRKVHSIFF